MCYREWERESEIACGCECAELGNADSVRVCMSESEREREVNRVKSSLLKETKSESERLCIQWGSNF